jgi:hypothetical protein
MITLLIIILGVVGLKYIVFGTKREREEKEKNKRP